MRYPHPLSARCRARVITRANGFPVEHVRRQMAKERGIYTHIYIYIYIKYEIPGSHDIHSDFDGGPYTTYTRSVLPVSPVRRCAYSRRRWRRWPVGSDRYQNPARSAALLRQAWGRFEIGVSLKHQQIPNLSFCPELSVPLGSLVAHHFLHQRANGIWEVDPRRVARQG